MHIMEGFLPWEWALFWYVLSVPVLILGVRSLKRLFEEHPEEKMMVVMSGAFIALLSSLKLPSITGSSSHPTGTGFSTIYHGPAVTAVLACIILIFQSMFLAHGGITTLGANVFSMGIAGPALAYFLYRMLRSRTNRTITVFIVTATADMFTYVVTSMQLALAFPGEGFFESLTMFLSVFALTQIPLSIVEGILFIAFFRYLETVRPALIRSKFPTGGVAQ